MHRTSKTVLGPGLRKEKHFHFQSTFAANSVFEIFFLPEVPILGPDWIYQGNVTSSAANSSCSSQAGVWETALGSFPSVLFWGWQRVGWAGVSCEMGKSQECVHLNFSCLLWLSGRSYLLLASSTLCLYQNFEHCWFDSFQLLCVCILEVYSLWEAVIREGILNIRCIRKILLFWRQKCSVFKPGMIPGDRVTRSLLCMISLWILRKHISLQTSQKVCKSLQLENQFGPAAVIAASEGAEQDEPPSSSSPLHLSFAQLIIPGTAAPENALMMMFPIAAG